MGQIYIEYEKSAYTANGILLDSETFITCDHLFNEEGGPFVGHVVFYPDPSIVKDAIDTATKSGTSLQDIVLEDGSSTFLKDITTNVLWDTLQRGPCRFATIKLRRPLPTVPILPLSLEQPVLPMDVSFTSFGDITLLQRTSLEPIARGKRHVSDLRLAEEVIVHMPPSSNMPFLSMKYNAAEIKALPKTFAAPQLGDSGGASIMSDGSVVGLHDSRFTLHDGTIHNFQLPFYKAKDWLHDLGFGK